MPPIQRKIVGPESSVPWRLYLEPHTEKTKICDENEKLQDIKREIYIKVGVLTHVKGSAYLEAGQTKILAAVHPPRESSKQNKKSSLGCINCELKYDKSASSNVNKAAIAKSEKYLSISLKKAIEPAVCRQEFPNFQIDIVVHVLQDNGCVLSSAINCAGVALVDGGVPMFDTIVASTANICCGKILINPICNIECFHKNSDLDDEGTVVLAQLPNCSQISECFQKGFISYNCFKNVCRDLTNENQNMFKIVSQVLIKKVRDSIAKEKTSE